MTKMTCNELGGACEKVFEAETFDEISNLSRQHGLEMAEAKDADHLAAMERMVEVMSTPNGLNDWMDDKRKLFESK